MRAVFVAALLILAPAAAAQTAAPPVAVSGVVRDTLTRRPVAGAWVQIVAWDGTAAFTRTARRPTRTSCVAACTPSESSSGWKNPIA
jgi:hypothetical protein